jgi:transposase-like protein
VTKEKEKGDKLLFCFCPYCKKKRKKTGRSYNIIRKGYERNGLARFLCTKCKKWFNEKTGKTMSWLER